MGSGATRPSTADGAADDASKTLPPSKARRGRKGKVKRAPQDTGLAEPSKVHTTPGCIEATGPLSEGDLRRVLASVRRDPLLAQMALFNCGVDDRFVSEVMGAVLLRCFYAKHGGRSRGYKAFTATTSESHSGGLLESISSVASPSVRSRSRSRAASAAGHRTHMTTTTATSPSGWGGKHGGEYKDHLARTRGRTPGGGGGDAGGGRGRGLRHGDVPGARGADADVDTSDPPSGFDDSGLWSAIELLQAQYAKPLHEIGTSSAIGSSADRHTEASGCGVSSPSCASLRSRQSEGDAVDGTCDDDPSVFRRMSSLLSAGMSLASSRGAGAAFTSLVQLNLSGNPVTDASLLPIILSLRDLGTQLLNVSRTLITDRSLVSLAGVLDSSDLRRVWMSGCERVTDAGIVVMCEAVAQTTSVEWICSGCPNVSSYLEQRIHDANAAARQLYMLKIRAYHNWYAIALCSHGMKCFARGDTAEAGRYFRQAERLQPALWQAAHGLMLIHRKRGDEGGVRASELKVVALKKLPLAVAWEGGWLRQYRKVVEVCALALAGAVAGHAADKRARVGTARRVRSGHLSGQTSFSARHRRTQRRRTSSRKYSEQIQAEQRGLEQDLAAKRRQTIMEMSARDRPPPPVGGYDRDRRPTSVVFARVDTHTSAVST